MSMTVRDFKHIAGQNDVEYIKLLEEELKIQEKLTAKAIARLKEQSVERKHGKWLNVMQEGACSWSGTCSCCRTRNDIPPPILAHFCPNCGADMREREGE